LLCGFVRGGFLDDAQVQAPDLGGVVCCVELLGEPSDSSVVLQQKLDGVDLVGHSQVPSVVAEGCTVVLIVVLGLAGATGRRSMRRCEMFADQGLTAPDSADWRLYLQKRWPKTQRPLTQARTPGALRVRR